MVYFRSASVYIITLNRLHYFPWYKPCRWRHGNIVNGISEKHGGRIEKGCRNFCKKSPFGFHLEYILRNLVTAYRKKLLKTRTYHFESASLWWKSEKNDWTVFLPSPEESANERVSRRRLYPCCSWLFHGAYSTKEQKVGIVRQICFSWSQDTISLLI